MSDLRDRLTRMFQSLPQKGVTGVTPVTDVPVTPQKPQSYASYAGYASELIKPRTVDRQNVTAQEIVEDFDERAAIAEHDGGLQRPHAELLAALETAPLGPEHDRAAIIEAVAMHLDRLAPAGIVKR